MPWLSQAGAVLDAWYPGQSNGTSLANVLFGKVDPSGHLPVTFPTSLSQVPASSAEQFPGVNGHRCCIQRDSTSATAGTTPRV